MGQHLEVKEAYLRTGLKYEFKRFGSICTVGWVSKVSLHCNILVRIRRLCHLLFPDYNKYNLNLFNTRVVMFKLRYNKR